MGFFPWSLFEMTDKNNQNLFKSLGKISSPGP